MQENKSEVAHLLQQIENEFVAAQRGLTGFAVGTAKHQFITARMERMGAAHQELKQLVGEEEAAQLLVETINQAGNEEA